MKDSSDPILRAQGLSRFFGSRVVFKNLSFQIQDGEWVSIAGASGEGKSTLLYTLAGLMRPSEGRLYFRDKNLYSLSPFFRARYRNRYIGFLYQDFRLISHWSVRKNILLPGLLSSEKNIQKKTDHIIELLGISHIRNAVVRNISGGEAQRTALGRALLLSPQILLLDEPTGNLDERTELEILNLIEKIRKESNLTVISVTHSKNVLVRSDRIMNLEQGQIKISIPQKPVKKKSGKGLVKKKKIVRKKVSSKSFSKPKGSKTKK